MVFRLDTTGILSLPNPQPEDPAGKWSSTTIEWADLDAFTQGYIEQMFASSYDPLPGFMATADQPEPNLLRTVPIGFSDLAPETLAQITADCKKWCSVDRGVYSNDWPNSGRSFWAIRQSDDGHADFPRLNVQLNDTNKVVFA